jgi:hypothetical protein
MTPCRKDLKNPVTAVGGILDFDAKLPGSVIRTLRSIIALFQI